MGASAATAAEVPPQARGDGEATHEQHQQGLRQAKESPSMSVGATSDHQFGEMKSRLDTQGGFTYDPRKRDFVTSGYSVAAHESAELKESHSEGGVTEQHIRGFVKGSAPTWQQQKSQGRGQEMIGGWRDDEGGKDVLDLPKVFPATPVGHQKSRQAQVLRNQEASFSLHEMSADPNPWFTGSNTTAPGRMSAQFPEFGAIASKKKG